MRLALCLNAALLGFASVALGQETTGALPVSMRLGLDPHAMAAVEAAPFDADAAEADDRMRDAMGKVPLYGRFVAVEASLGTAGTWLDLPGGDRLWRLRITSPGAIAIELFLEDVHLPPGAQLHVYSADGDEVYGGYTAAHVQENGALATDLTRGDACVLEYHEPAAVRGEGSLRLRRMAHAYRMADLLSGECEVDVLCPEGDNWVDQRNAVVRIRVVDPSGTGFCTGALVNNTAQDCKPYVLTAHHCIVDSQDSNFATFQFRWNYQRASCEGGTTNGFNMVGCTRRADSNDNGGDNGSDFALLELTSAVPASVGAYYAGWDATGTGSNSGVCIHHPDGDYKKISTYATNLVSTTWGGPSGSHWRVTWAATANGHGVTEPGSSGAPLFNASKRIIGTLTGGSSFCDTPTAPDYFGKMSFHFGTANPNPAAEELRNWLSPVFSATTLNGSYNPCATIGIDEVRLPEPEVFPNPFTDRFTVRLPESLQGADRLEVTDATGRLLHAARISSSTCTVEAMAWSGGTYVLSVFEGGARTGSVRVVR